jgi:hypothetical protein
MDRKKLMIGATAGACLLASGCVVEPVGPRRPYYGPPRAVVVEPAAPPPAVVVAPPAEEEVAPGVEQPAPPLEVIPPAPGPAVAWLWIPGWWAWEGGRWAWHRGYWGHRPHPGAVWVPHQWVRGPRGGWVHQGGQWR